ncbi:MAG TPA: methyltransferase type 11 [Rhodobacteraceae bacterium]|jgi:predicted TPR repeat methyltransferase|nr:methyltransferase domain-containing protein [Paracoccaceae bacterium]HBG98511.1 methyltransferase type 11 [Paracoccaceae bacterium]
MARPKDYLDEVYKLEDAEETRALYDEWAETYDDTLNESGYVTPDRCAEALAQFAPDPEMPLLDFGCGTGRSGVALHAQGFTTLDGIDLSPGMLAVARQRGLYRNLIEAPGNGPLPIDPASYGLITAVGVIGAGAAPLSVFDELMTALAPGGLFAFSFNDHTLEDPVFEGRVAEYADTGAAGILFREHGDHLPAMELGAVVYVLQKR